MADTLGQADIRGLDIDKLIKGFENEDFVFKNNLTVTPAGNREIRWFQKLDNTPLDSTDTTGITASQVVGVAFGALPPIAESSVTRMTSYIKHFAIESPWFTYADIKDSDPDMFGLNLRELKRAVENQIDYRILDVLSGTCLLSGSAKAAWATTASCNPFLDLLSGSTEIRKKGYDINNLVAWVHPDNYKSLFDYFITTKGSSVPQFASGKVADGVITKIANVGIIVTNNATSGQVMMLVPQRAATWKSFTPLTAVTKEEPGVGVKIRAWEDGEVIFTDPNAAYLIKLV